MTAPSILDKRERLILIGFASTLGLVLASGLLPTVSHIVKISESYFQTPKDLHSWRSPVVFLLLSAFFYFTLPTKFSRAPNPWSPRHLVEISILPLLIALIYGFFAKGSLADVAFDKGFANANLCWLLIFAPIGEELLFRGWCVSVSNRVWKNKLFAATPPLPAGLWFSAIAFSLWHLQNISALGWMGGLFQISYTFFVGLWLGVLRWHSGRLWPCIIAHILLNLLSILI